MSEAQGELLPSLLLIHGAGGTGEDWGAIRPFFEGHTNVLAPSLPGRRGAPGRAPGTAAEAARFLADEVLASRRRGGAPRFIAVGISYGGAVAIELALARPEGLAGLVLMSTGARLRVHPSIFEALSAGRDLARGGLLRPDVPPESALADWRAADAFDRLGQPLDVGVPCLVMGGEDDALTPPKYARYLASAIPGAELELVPRAGHMLPDDAPALTAARILRFVRERVASADAGVRGG